jgi:hypothetical protein
MRHRRSSLLPRELFDHERDLALPDGAEVVERPGGEEVERAELAQPAPPSASASTTRPFTLLLH